MTEDSPSDFYLGREVDLQTGKVTQQQVDYPSRNLTTHGVVVGMTGSGKTGLCLVLLEEAALDGIPAILIDPKGDMANLLLTFPELKPSDFKPWIDPDEAKRKKMPIDEFAEKTAADWKDGLAQWNQTGERVQKLKESAEYLIFTPGANTGLPISIVHNFDAPKGEVLAEDLSQKASVTTSALLGLAGIDADPLRSREHILISNIFVHCWTEGEDVPLEKLIEYVRTPPVQKLGVFDVKELFPKKDRDQLAFSLNNILASPTFQTWMEGLPLDIDLLTKSSTGKPRHCIFNLAHLTDEQRMFFVTLLLEQIIFWTRNQSGTSSLRMLVYFDEVFGYLPPHPANPPSKTPILTLLKQARAFGVGTLLATQNPVDIDYKALSNAGTWFIGKLQTERDKARLLAGLESAVSTQGSMTDPAVLDKLISGLQQRQFLYHNVHAGKPIILNSRWALCYLRGPMSREQISELMKEKRQELAPLMIARQASSAAAKPATGKSPKGSAKAKAKAGQTDPLTSNSDSSANTMTANKKAASTTAPTKVGGMMSDALVFAYAGESEIGILPKMANRHGLIAGATGTGKTVTLQMLAEQFSNMGVPVFMADIKGDLTGISQKGSPENSKVMKRLTDLGIDRTEWTSCPVTLWDVFGEQGHPLRTTISEMGPIHMARLLNLTDVQSGVLNLAFKFADEWKLFLTDIKDLQALLMFIAENQKSFKAKYGNVTSASIGAIQRSITALESQGGDKFFGEPALDIDDPEQLQNFLKVTNGKGVINILAADKLINNPLIYSTFLYWLLSELFENLPEVGDLDKPKLVFFFDEAHLLFKGQEKAVLDKVEQLVRLIRSKGVGVYFCTQNPIDIPDRVLGQLGNRVQHALRSNSPRDMKDIRAAADTFKENPDLDVRTEITSLQVGEALVSVLDETGSPTPVEKALVIPPCSQLGPIDAGQRKQLLENSVVADVYDTAIDRLSAYEIIKGEKPKDATPPELADPETEKRMKEFQREFALKGGSTWFDWIGRQMSSVGGMIMTSAKRAIFGRVGTRIGRNIWGTIMKGK